MLQGQSRIAGQPNYAVSIDDTIVIATTMNDESMHPPRQYSRPQHRLVRGISKVRVPDLLELGSELRQLRCIGAPFDPHFDIAYIIDDQKGTKK